METKVSILARSKNRALLIASQSSQPGETRFQSSPGQRTGRYYYFLRQEYSLVGGFNPRPVKEPGATVTVLGDRTRKRGFNPRPVKEPGATLSGFFTSGKVSILFQSSPGQRTGRYCPASVPWAGQWLVSILARSKNRALRRPQHCGLLCPGRFNPRPVKEPGATAGTPGVGRAPERVSILARSKNRALHSPTDTMTIEMDDVSILARSKNRALPLWVEYPGGGIFVSILARSKNRALPRAIFGPIFWG